MVDLFDQAFGMRTGPKLGKITMLFSVVNREELCVNSGVIRAQWCEPWCQQSTVV